MRVRISSAVLLCALAASMNAADAKTKPHYVTVKIVGKKILQASSGGNMSVNTSRASECITPAHGSSLVVGSGNVTDVTSSGDVLFDGKPLAGRQPENGDPSPRYNIGWWVRENSPQRICIEVFARTSAKGTNVFYNAKAVASESYLKK